jgi:hypothetical protein
LRGLGVVEVTSARQLRFVEVESTFDYFASTAA